jgi:sarcosine oxidase subunit beta
MNLSTRPAGNHETADAIVIGGGIIGVACALFIARAGLRVVLLERGGLGSGTSRTGQGGVGVDLDLPEWDLHWHAAAMASYAELNAEGFDPDYSRCGGLLVSEDEGDAEHSRAGVARLKAIGLAVDWLDPGELRQAEPALSHHLAGAVRIGEIAQVSPLAAVSKLAALAKQAGAEIRVNTPVKKIACEAGAVVGAVTAEGTVSASCVVVACGIWSRELSAGLQLAVPIWPLKGHVLATEPMPGALRHYLMSTAYGAAAAATLETEIDANGPRPGSPRVATVLQNLKAGPMLIGSSREFAGFDRSAIPARVAEIANRAIRIMPELAQKSIVRVFTGLRPWTPDGRPLVGPTATHRGLFFAAGHGGEGTTGALLTGRLIADMIAGRQASFSTAPLSPDRFRLDTRTMN